MIQSLESRAYLASISGVIYFDQNSDGFKQFNEPLLKDVVIYIDVNKDGERGASEPAIASNVLGQYGFTGLPSGTYALRVETPTGLIPTNPSNGTQTQTIQAAHTRSNINFALGPIVGPEIDIIGTADRPIRNGANSPSKRDGTDFGKVALSSSSRIREFVIENPGNQDLIFSKALVRITGAHRRDFKVTRQPPRILPAGSRFTIRITFDPTAAGRRSATVVIASNDASEPSYRFAISGVGKS